MLVTIVESIECFRLTVPAGTRAEQYRGQGYSKAACGKRGVNGRSHVRENKRLVTNGLILFTNHKQDISAPSMPLSIQPAWRLNKLSIFQILSRTSPRRFPRNEWRKRLAMKPGAVLLYNGWFVLLKLARAGPRDRRAVTRENHSLGNRS